MGGSQWIADLPATSDGELCVKTLGLGNLRGEEVAVGFAAADEAVGGAVYEDLGGAGTSVVVGA